MEFALKKKNRNTAHAFDDDQDASDHEESSNHHHQQQQQQKDLVIPLVEDSKDLDKPILLRNRLPDNLDERQRFKSDLDRRPEQPSYGQRNVRVEDFGAALLRGMGWNPGDDKKQVGVQVPEVRPALLGLGAIPKLSTLKHDKETNKNKNRPIGGFQNGNLVRVISGKFKDNFGVVKQATGVPGLNNVILQLDPGSEESVLTSLPEVMVKHEEVQPIDNYLSLPSSHPGRVLLEKVRKREHEKHSKKRKHSTEDLDDDGDESDGKSKKKKHKKDKKKKSKESGDRSKETRACWLVPGIRVRIVSKSLADGAYYAQKGIVQDVLDHIRCKCTLAVGEGRDRKTVENVSQRHLNTALPKPSKDSKVLIIQGKYKGEHGVLLDRDKSKLVAKVQLTNDLSIHSVSYDDVAEYCF